MLADFASRSRHFKRAIKFILASGSLFVAVLCARVAVHAQAQQAPSAPGANGAAAPAGAQGAGQGGPAGGPGAAGRGRGGGFRKPSPADWNDHDGWVSMFDGKTLDNWKGNKDVWSVEDGQIVGTASSDNPVGTTYLIWTGGQPANFTLKLDFMLAGTAPNTGIQFRSFIRPPGFPGRGGVGFGGNPTVVCSDEEAINDLNPQTATPAAGAGGFGGPGGAGGQGGRGATAAQGVAPTAGAAGAAPQGGPGGAQPGANGAGRGGPGGGRGRGPSDAMAKANAPYWLSGPQADFDPQNTFSGNFYDQDGRGEMVFRGQVVQTEMCKQPEEIATLGDPADLAKFINPLGQWNRYLIIARDHVILEAINDHVMSVTYDDDPTRFRANGYIGLQLEGNGKLYFKNLYVKYR